MTAIAIISAKHSPGASTLALALASSCVQADLPPIVIEADPAGGDLAARLGLPVEPGIVTLAAAGRHGLDRTLLAAHAQACAGGFDLVVGPPSADQAAGAVERLGRSLVAGTAPEGVVLVDVGRWSRRSPATELLGAVDHIVVVLRPTVEGVAHAQGLLATLPTVAASVTAVIVGQSPYGREEVAQACAPVPVEVIDHDIHAAQQVGVVPAGNRWLRRTTLLRSANALLNTLAEAAQACAPPPAQASTSDPTHEAVRS